jgi:membrane-bound lytic murein transglycosylase B
MLMRVVVGLGVVGVVIAGVLLYEPAAADYGDRDDVRAYVEETAAAHDFDAQALMVLFAEARRQQSILDAISRPAERTMPWHDYRDIFVTPKRIAQGVAFWREHEEILNRAAVEFAVDPRIIVAIIGVETRYGRNAGSYRVLDALATLSFDYPPRSKFFRKELTEFLLLAREEDKNPTELKGSYAGAMGYGQFIPSSFRAYAVDFDGDGVRDIWNNPSDAIGSVGNYFHRHGWRGGERVVVPVQVAAELPEGVANASLQLKYSVGELRSMGVHIPPSPDVSEESQESDDLAEDTPVALFRMEAEKGTEYWLGLHNFYVITRYNHSRLYALAVLQLGDAIAAARSEDATMASEDATTASG